jgi:hypothetical protein
MNTTFTDYYAVLGISPDTDIDAIKTAYRRLAMQYHPDRGGSHEKMLQINEAFRVLINPTSRAEYDHWRANVNDPQARQAAEEAVHTAAAQAANYPPSSDQVDSWMDSVAKDFLSASYGQTQWGCAPMPTIENSVSGVLFLLVGGIAGAVVGFNYFWQPGSRHGLAILFCAAGGAKVAQLLHRGIRDSMPRTPASPPSPTPPGQPLLQHAHVKCPKCGQQLRFMPNSGRVTLRCPKCQEAFTPCSDHPQTDTSPSFL